MKKYSFILAAAAICMLAACNKEQDLPVSKKVTEEAQAVLAPALTYISANGGEESVKSSIDDESAAFSWNTGDQIAVFSGDTYYVSQPLASTYDGTNAAVFAFDSDIESGRKDFAVYPASLVMNGTDPWYDCALNHDASQLHIVLPSSYKLSQVKDNVSPTPMIAVNTSGSGLEFKSICALVRVTVKNIAWDAKTIKVTFPGIRVTGDFDLYGFVAGTDGLEPTDAFEEGVDDTIIIDLEKETAEDDKYIAELVVNVPVPMGVAGNYEYEMVKVTACDESTLPINYIVSALKVDSSETPAIPQKWAPGRKACRKVSAILPVFSAYSTKDGGAYAHVTNTKGRTIVFAPGNLQARLDVPPGKTESWNIKENLGSADLWRFAAHQYDAIADDKPDDGRTNSYNSMETPHKGDWIDLFSWIGNDGGIASSTSVDESKKWGIAYHISSGTSSAYGNTATGYELYNDWGKLSIQYGEDCSYASNKWHTPTKDEWDLVINRRYAGSSGYTGLDPTAVKAKITVSAEKTVCGLILFPDNYVHPYGVPAINKAHHGASTKWTLGDGQSKCADNPLTLEQWEKLEGAGCAFLPFTSRTQFSSASTVLTDSVAEAWYWSTTPVGGTKLVPYTLAFNDIEEPAGHRYYSTSSTTLSTTNNGASRAYGCGVRLTRWVKNE